MSWPFGDFAEIVEDPLKGRCLVATREFSPGDKLWVEEAYVFATADEDSEEDISADCKLWGQILAVSSKKKKKGKKKAVSTDKALELMDALLDLRSVAAVDTARCLLQLIVMALKAPQSALDNPRLLFLQLEPSNFDQCLEDIAAFRLAHPSAIPEKLTTEFVARLVGVLNNNQMELEDIVGSGLFVGTAILEHNCRPNCSFSTNENILYMMATEPIRGGDRFSIDYGNNYCRPTFYRQMYLYKTYKFICNCETCLGPDRSRNFVCPTCRSGVVCALLSSTGPEAEAIITSAVESGRDPDVIFIPGFGSLSKCSECGEIPPAEYALSAAELEETIVNSGLVQAPILSSDSCSALWNEIEKIRHSDGRVLHDTHYLMFWALDKIAEYSSTAAASGLGKYSSALDYAKDLQRVLYMCLPKFHHEKVISCDKLGQLSIASGDITGASEYFAKACKMSALVCGVDNPSTVKLNELATNTPTNVSDLMAHYNKASATGDNECSEDETWGDCT